jgi:hypothetical protein
MYFPGYLGPIEFTTLGTKWEPGPNTASFGPFGTPGGATWSVMAIGIMDASTFDGHSSLATTSFSFLTPGDELAMIDTALDTWDVVSGFKNLGMVGDGGVGFGAPDASGGHLGDIRIGAIAFDGPFGVLAHNYQPGTQAIFGAGGSIAGDSHYDNTEFWVDDPFEDGIGPEIDLPTVLLHEFGHALGLGHSTDPASVMYPFYSGARRSLHADDIAGIQFIYGIQAIPEPSSMALVGIVAIGLIGVGVRRRKRAA